MKPINNILLAFATTTALAACSSVQPVTVGGAGLRSDSSVVPQTSRQAELDAFLADKPIELKDHYRALFLGGPRNAVLNHMRIGLAAMDLGYFEDAEDAFDGALLRIERVYANDAKAKLAKSKWHAEAVKDFKGEPYERAMAYLYRGLLYLREGDYENARATFLAGEFQDSVSETEEFQSDFAVLNYLAGWSSQCAGDSALASRYYGEAARHNRELVAPAAASNLLMVADLGRAPIKTGTGKHRERLEFQPNPGSTGGSATFVIAAKAQPQRAKATEATNVYWQSSTRGGRPIQAILNGKAQFKDGARVAADVGSTTAEVLVQSGSILGNDNMLLGGIAAGLFSVGASIVSARTQPAADTRYWDNLPHAVLLASAIAPNGDYGVEAEFVTSGSSAAPGKAAAMRASAGRCAIAWVRSEPAAAIPAVAPGSELTPSQAKKLPKTIVRDDADFRASLLTAKSE